MCWRRRTARVARGFRGRSRRGQRQSRDRMMRVRRLRCSAGVKIAHKGSLVLRRGVDDGLEVHCGW